MATYTYTENTTTTWSKFVNSYFPFIENVLGCLFYFCGQHHLMLQHPEEHLKISLIVDNTCKCEVHDLIFFGRFGVTFKLLVAIRQIWSIWLKHYPKNLKYFIKKRFVGTVLHLSLFPFSSLTISWIYMVWQTCVLVLISFPIYKFIILV